MISQPERDLIDRFINGELSGIDLANIQRRIDEDEQFSKKVNFQKLLRSGILFSKEDELKKFIIQKISFKRSRIPFSLKLIVTFLIVTGAGITLWFYVETDSSTTNKKYFSLPFLSKEKDKKEKKVLTESKNKIKKEVSKAEDEITNQTKLQGEDNKNDQEENTAIKSLSGDTSTSNLEEDKDIVIKKDKLLISATIPISDRSSTDSKNTESKGDAPSLSQEAAQKLNPAANVPEDDHAVESLTVEFWVSPINYRGYKMSKNRLILFGIEEPDAIKLYRSNDALYMKYGAEFFRLVNTYDFLAYQRLKETDVPLAIRQ
jgi:hypothetical protein